MDELDAAIAQARKNISEGSKEIDPLDAAIAQARKNIAEKAKNVSLASPEVTPAQVQELTNRPKAFTGDMEIVEQQHPAITGMDRLLFKRIEESGKNVGQFLRENVGVDPNLQIVLDDSGRPVIQKEPGSNQFYPVDPNLDTLNPIARIDEAGKELVQDNPGILFEAIGANPTGLGIKQVGKQMLKEAALSSSGKTFNEMLANYVAPNLEQKSLSDIAKESATSGAVSAGLVGVGTGVGGGGLIGATIRGARKYGGKAIQAVSKEGGTLSNIAKNTPVVKTFLSDENKMYRALKPIATPEDLASGKNKAFKGKLDGLVDNGLALSKYTDENGVPITEGLLKPSLIEGYQPAYEKGAKIVEQDIMDMRTIHQANKDAVVPLSSIVGNDTFQDILDEAVAEGLQLSSSAERKRGILDLLIESFRENSAFNKEFERYFRESNGVITQPTKEDARSVFVDFFLKNPESLNKINFPLDEVLRFKRQLDSEINYASKDGAQVAIFESLKPLASAIREIYKDTIATLPEGQKLLDIEDRLHNIIPIMERLSDKTGRDRSVYTNWANKLIPGAINSNLRRGIIFAQRFGQSQMGQRALGLVGSPDASMPSGVGQAIAKGLSIFPKAGAQLGMLAAYSDPTRQPPLPEPILGNSGAVGANLEANARDILTLTGDSAVYESIISSQNSEELSQSLWNAREQYPDAFATGEWGVDGVLNTWEIPNYQQHIQKQYDEGQIDSYQLLNEKKVIGTMQPQPLLIPQQNIQRHQLQQEPAKLKITLKDVANNAKDLSSTTITKQYDSRRDYNY